MNLSLERFAVLAWSAMRKSHANYFRAWAAGCRVIGSAVQARGCCAPQKAGGARDWLAVVFEDAVGLRGC